MKYRIIVIDDEYLIRLSLREGLNDLGYHVETAETIDEGMALAQKFMPHFILLDNRLKEYRGIDYIEAIKQIDSDIQIVLMTAYGSVSQAVEAVKKGAYDYIQKPFDIDALDIIIKRSLEQLITRRSLDLITPPKYNLVGESNAIRQIKHQIEIVAKNNSVDVLIHGETGTGKEVVANLIHSKSARGNIPMVKINCGAIPPNLLESELFGYEKGAFTGAASSKKGLLELADGGTVFLDEIGEMPISMQSKLLTFLEDRRFKRVGGLRDIEVNLRVIAATNRDLHKAMIKGEFREDLFYRLSVMQLELPPLREHTEDIIPLCYFFLERFNKKFGKNIRCIEDSYADELKKYYWKGNVRELRNVIERCCLFCNGDTLKSTDLLEGAISSKDKKKKAEEEKPLVFTENGINLPREVEKFEKGYIDKALSMSNNNLSRAAELLGITRFSLRRKMEKFTNVSENEQ